MPIIPLDRAIIQRVEAPLVLAFLDALPDGPSDPAALARTRSCLASLQDPDVRYLVACLMGPEAPAVARITSAVLEAAGAPTGTLGRSLEAITLSGSPLDDALIATSGTHAASAIYTLHETQPALGEVNRREATVLLGLIAFAENARRVALLLDETLVAEDPVHAPKADLVVLTRAPVGPIRRALALVPDGRPVVVAALDDDARAAVLEWEKRTGSPLLLGGRDHDVQVDAGGRSTFRVRDDPYISFDPIPGIDPVHMSCGLAAALALGTLGIRMRDEWLGRGIDELRGRERVAT